MRRKSICTSCLRTSVVCLSLLHTRSAMSYYYYYCFIIIIIINKSDAVSVYHSDVMPFHIAERNNKKPLWIFFLFYNFPSLSVLMAKCVNTYFLSAYVVSFIHRFIKCAVFTILLWIRHHSTLGCGDVFLRLHTKTAHVVLSMKAQRSRWCADVMNDFYFIFIFIFYFILFAKVLSRLDV